MFGFRFTMPPHKARQKAAGRFSTLAKAEVLDWSETAMADAWKALEDYRRDPRADALEDIEYALQQILGAVDSLRARS
ncbi:hypothetical protein GCM10010149_87910 [Nonomuraea roseoviolacea subsp. roseoviolacea]|uniref:hypothetical protein n=1 Tax=Nonomuraea roseoviolacea TaxID=103837 RepID=UPI0031E02C10